MEAADVVKRRVANKGTTVDGYLCQLQIAEPPVSYSVNRAKHEARKEFLGFVKKGELLHLTDGMKIYRRQREKMKQMVPDGLLGSRPPLGLAVLRQQTLELFGRWLLQ